MKETDPFIDNRTEESTRTAAQRDRRAGAEKIFQDIPAQEQLRQEYVQAYTGRKPGRFLYRIILTGITVAAAAILIATLFLPILRIYGTSMSPTLQEGDVIIAMKTRRVHQGELMAFYFNNKILVKRVIAEPGDKVDIDDAGNVIVNGRALDESYLISRSKGNTKYDGYHLSVSGSDRQIFSHGGSTGNIGGLPQFTNWMYRTGSDGRPNSLAGVASQTIWTGEITDIC